MNSASKLSSELNINDLRPRPHLSMKTDQPKAMELRFDMLKACKHSMYTTYNQSESTVKYF